MTTEGFILAYDPQNIVMSGNSPFHPDFGNFWRRLVKIPIDSNKISWLFTLPNIREKYMNPH